MPQIDHSKHDSQVQDDKNKRTSIRILDQLFGHEDELAVGVCLWDGSYWPSEKPRPVTLVLKHPGSLRAMFLGGTELAVAEA